VNGLDSWFFKKAACISKTTLTKICSDFKTSFCFMIDFNSSQEGKIDIKVKSRHELKASFLLIFKLKLKNSTILKMNFMQLETLLSTFRLSSGVLALYAGLGVRRYGLGLFKFVWLKGEL
jgi:hypothetical protein